jgi:hypothetical protein
LKLIKRLAVLFIIITGFAVSIYSLDWPVAERILLRCFGDNTGGSFYTGIDLGGNSQNVYSVADGEIIFYHKENENYSTVPRGNGNFIVVQHEGEIQSVYSHLEKDSMSLDSYTVNKRPLRLSRDIFKNSVLGILDDDYRDTLLEGFKEDGEYYIFVEQEVTEKEQREIFDILSETGVVKPIGKIGDSGAAEGPYLFFMLIDINEHIIINPIFNEENTPLVPQITPSRHYEGPVIEKMLLSRDDSLIDIYDELTIDSGTGDIYCKAYCISDFGDFEKRIVPYRFTLISSGMEISTIVLNAFEERENRFVLWNTETGYDELYIEDVFGEQRLIKLGSINFLGGINNLELTVEDIFGKVSRTEVQLNVE